MQLPTARQVAKNGLEELDKRAIQPVSGQIYNKFCNK